MRFTDAFDRQRRRQARKITARALRKAAPGATIKMVVWAPRAQTAFLDCGWHPISEAPRVNDRTGEQWTELTMEITKGE